VGVNFPKEFAACCCTRLARILGRARPFLRPLQAVAGCSGLSSATEERSKGLYDWGWPRLFCPFLVGVSSSVPLRNPATSKGVTAVSNYGRRSRSLVFLNFFSNCYRETVLGVRHIAARRIGRIPGSTGEVIEGARQGGPAQITTCNCPRPGRKKSLSTMWWIKAINKGSSGGAQECLRGMSIPLGRLTGQGFLGLVPA
jgi:hypothetical protein